MLVERYRGKPVALIGVNLDENRDAAARMIARCNMTWRNCAAGGNPAIHQRWDVGAIPTVYVIDANGVIRHKRLSGANLEPAIDALLADINVARAK